MSLGRLAGSPRRPPTRLLPEAPVQVDAWFAELLDRTGEPNRSPPGDTSRPSAPGHVAGTGDCAHVHRGGAPVRRPAGGEPRHPRRADRPGFRRPRSVVAA